MNKLKGGMVAENHDWQAETDLRHLTEAHKIKKDKKRHAAARKMAAKKLKELEDTRASMVEVQHGEAGPQKQPE